MLSAPVGRPPDTVGVADMVKVSWYPRAQSPRLTCVGPVGTLLVESQPGYTRTSCPASLYTSYVTLPAGLVILVGRARASASNVVVRCRPPPVGVLQPLGRLLNVPVWVVSTSEIVLV